MSHERPDAISFDRPEEEATYALLPGYALGITTADEAEAVEALLARYPALVAELADYRRLSAQMALDVPPIEPPPGAWDDILARLDAGAEAPVSEPQERGTLARLVDELLSPRLRLSPALAAVVVVAVAGVVGLLASEVARLRQTQEALLTEREQQQLALELMRARDVGWVRMNDPNEPDASPSFAWLVYSPEDQAGVILASGFPELEPEMTYQLWASGDEGRVSLGLFDVSSDGTGAITFRLPDDITRFRSMGITPEPATGSPGPTSPAVVRLDLEEFVDRLRDRS